MPNWCNNYAEFTHDDPAQLERIVEAVNNEQLFNEFLPFNGEVDPRELWGCKWDASDCIAQLFTEDSKVTIGFTTPWAPPIPFYEAMEGLGFTVTAYYYEPGMAFCGRFNEYGDQELPVERNCIPADIDEVFNIEEELEELYIDSLEEVERYVYEGLKAREAEQIG